MPGGLGFSLRPSRFVVAGVWCAHVGGASVVVRADSAVTFITASTVQDGADGRRLAGIWARRRGKKKPA